MFESYYNRITSKKYTGEVEDMVRARFQVHWSQPAEGSKYDSQSLRIYCQDHRSSYVSNFLD